MPTYSKSQKILRMFLSEHGWAVEGENAIMVPPVTDIKQIKRNETYYDYFPDTNEIIKYTSQEAEEVLDDGIPLLTKKELESVKRDLKKRKLAEKAIFTSIKSFDYFDNFKEQIHRNEQSVENIVEEMKRIPKKEIE